MKKKSLLLLFSLIILLGLAVFLYGIYAKIKAKNVTETTYIYIPTNAGFKDVAQLVGPYLKNEESFTWIANKKNYPNKIRPGKFKITEGMSNEELVNHLRGGSPETVRVTFNNQDTPERLAGRIAMQIEADSISLLKVINDTSFLEVNGFSQVTGFSMYIPNSYEFYWNTSADQFRARMLKEYEVFWNPDRRNQAKKLNLSPQEVSTLASIVQKETSTIPERPVVAGLYLNRLKDNWPLQADPTVIFALHQKFGQDTTIKRVLLKDLNTDSPYNTYKKTGLPPGPIAMPDISSIDAVLNPATHNYYYMCASVDRIGQHEFTGSLSQHNINAAKYQAWVNKQGIQR